MAVPNNTPKESPFVETIANSVPGWGEVPQEGAGAKSKRVGLGFGHGPVRWAIEDRLDRVYPPHKRIFGLARRTVLIIAGIAFLALLGLIIGLAVGLSYKSEYVLLCMTVDTELTTLSSKPRNLPLPAGAETYTGDLTYYEPGLGACGITSTAEEDIVSISHFTYDAVQTGSDPNQNPLCGRKVRAQREYNGKIVSIDLTVVDRCKFCLSLWPAVPQSLVIHKRVNVY